MSNYSLIDIASKFKSGLLAKATDGEYSNKEFREDLDKLLSDKQIEKMVPSFIRICHTSDDFRRSIQAKFSRYAERRNFIETEL